MRRTRAAVGSGVASQIVTVPSFEVAIKRWQSGLNVTAFAGSLCVWKESSSWPAWASHIINQRQQLRGRLWVAGFMAFRRWETSLIVPA
jgi:hypothetical protein